MVVDEFLALLGCAQQAVGAELVHGPRGSGGVVVDFCDGLLGEDVLLAFGVAQVRLDVFGSLCKVERRQDAFQVDALPDGGVDGLDQLVPELVLPDEDEGHGAHGVHAAVEHEADFLERVAPQEMCFVDDGDDLLVFGFVDVLKLLVQTEFRVAALEFCLGAKLQQEAVVEPARCELRVGQVQDEVVVFGQCVAEPADERALMSLMPSFAQALRSQSLRYCLPLST